MIMIMIMIMIIIIIIIRRRYNEETKFSVTPSFVLTPSSDSIILMENKPIKLYIYTRLLSTDRQLQCPRQRTEQHGTFTVQS